MKLPRAALSFSLLALPIHPTLAFWRLACSVSQTSRIDPILNPGRISGHVHKFAGGSNVNTNSSQDSLQASSCSTCQVQTDKSAYWTPQLYYQHSNGSIEEVQNDGMTVYYVGRGGNATNTVPFPDGFKMISGNSIARSYNQTDLTYGNTRPVADRVSFRCINEANDIPETHYINQTNCVNGLRAQLNFQSCWDGINLYKSDQSHVAYLSGIDYGTCPPSHPVSIPGLFFEVLYWSNLIDQTDGGRFVFSNGDTTGFGFHGDFLNGWDQDIQAQAVQECLYVDNGGVVSACAPLAPSNDVNFARTCLESPPVIAEDITGLLSSEALPGCNPITSGPANAPQVVCAANTTTPAANISSTAVSSDSSVSSLTSQTSMASSVGVTSSPATILSVLTSSSAHTTTIASGPPIATYQSESRFTRTIYTVTTIFGSPTTIAPGVFAGSASPMTTSNANFSTAAATTLDLPSGDEVLTLVVSNYTTLALVVPSSLAASVETSFSNLAEASDYISSVTSLAAAEAMATASTGLSLTNTTNTTSYLSPSLTTNSTVLTSTHHLTTTFTTLFTVYAPATVEITGIAEVTTSDAPTPTISKRRVVSELREWWTGIN